MSVRRFLAFVLIVACGAPAASPVAVHRHLDARQPWLPRNRARIDAFLDSHSGGVAVFDWDNTMMRNDIGDATFFWMLRHDKVLQPPSRDWSVTNRKLTGASKARLKACDALAEPGQPLPTSSNAACADALVQIYDQGGFDDETTVMMHQPYAWGAQLEAGHTPDEVRSFGEQAFRENSDAPIGATQTIGTRGDLPAWVRIYEPMKDLVGALRANGTDVWAITASSQWLGEVVAAKVGIDAHHVVGVRAMQSDGKLDYRLQGCGTEPDGADTVITFDRGKRCWINKEIFHLAPSEQLKRAKVRQAFAAGDSDTDLAMVQDATTLKLVIDRHRPLLMCNALSSGWLVQPMFIEPLAPKTDGYPCSTSRDHAGNVVTDEDGKPILDLR